jgi:ribosomal protein S18 acetylase RimI-like enzyme
MEHKLSIEIKDKLQRGYCIVSYDDDEFIINSLHVRKFYQQRGIATSLLRLAETIVYNLGGVFSCLYVINNSWMHEWYKRMGYVDTKVVLNNYYIKMIKLLRNTKAR